MEWVFVKIRERSLLSPPEQPYFLSNPPPAPPLSLQSDGLGLNSKVSPSMLLIIVILAVIFFVSGLVHLLVRFLLRPSYRDPEDADHVTALQGQLQQLFHLHDAGVDQSFIDTLPVFHYNAIIGSKSPFDCAVCLCEFEPEDKLRLLPKCSHAFHMECIDTWLLSHSTCPLCRANLLPDFSPHTSFSPFVFVLESEGEASREIVSDRDSVLRTSSHLGRTSSIFRTSSRLDSEFGSSRIESSHKSVEITVIDESVQPKDKVVPVKLGKFRNVDNGGGEGSSSSKNVDERRCFSMGSFEYVMDENSVLQVPIRTPMKKQSSKKPSLPLMPGRRAAMSECDCESRREFNEFEAIKIVEAQGHANTSNISLNDAERHKRESFSISKIWVRGKKDSMHSAASRASSFHFPAPVAANDKTEKSRRTISEMSIGRWGNGGSELGENQSCNTIDSQPNQPSFARKTLLWLVGRQNKIVHSSLYPHV